MRTDIVRTYRHKETAMPTMTAARQDRIELRVTKEEKRLLPAAREVVDRSERIVLTEGDTTRLLELLENPSKPTPALMAAAHRRAART